MRKLPAIKKERSGRMRLLNIQDLGKKSILQMPGKPGEFRDLIGWLEASAGYGGWVNNGGWASIRSVAQKMVEGKWGDLYDQTVKVESPGAFVVAQAGDKVGLTLMFRFTGPRILENAGSDYVKRLQEEGRWDELLQSLGEWRWEFPAGLLPVSATKNLEEFIIKAAKLEGRDEAGLILHNAKIVGEINTNPSHFAHAQYIVHGTTSEKELQTPSPEDAEIIDKTYFFTAQEIRELFRRGDLNSGPTLAALWAVGFH